MTTWLQEDENARTTLLGDIAGSVLTACGKPKTAEIAKEDIALLSAALIAWINGKPLREIEIILGKDLDDDSFTKRTCPRSLSFILFLIACIVNNIILL